jgi:GNAT superfamily N-acetyltransferase/predicted enzyme related to lactoylglutathione lyase
MIRRADELTDADVDGLARLLVESVEHGASVGFMHPLDPDEAHAFWRRVADGVAAGERAFLLAEDDVGIVGTVHLVLAQPPNQPHRADVTKLLVHPRARRRGLGAALMEELERLARDRGKNVLVLDTVTASPADRLYTRLGWRRAGEIPDFALLAHGGLGPTTVFYKRLDVDEPQSPVRELRVAVTADDYDRALAFYRDTLGLEERAAFSSEDGRVTILEAGRATLELLDPQHAAFVDQVEVGRRVAGHIRLALEVGDSAAVARRLADAGASMVAEPTETPWRSLNARLDAPAGLQLTLFTELG